MIKARIFIFTGNIHVGDIQLETISNCLPKSVTNICHQNMSPTKWKPLLKKWFILEVHNKNREYRETNFTWADFWYKLIILTKNKRWQSVSDSVTKIPSPTLCHRNLVWEPKMGWGVFHRERLHVFVCKLDIFLSNSQRVRICHFVSEVTSVKESHA